MAIYSKICAYLKRLDGVEVGQSHESGSRYFNAGEVRIRVSEHISYSCNPTTTMNILCDALTDSFCVLYGNRIVAIPSYNKLKEFLRNFVKVADVLAPLADVRANAYKKKMGYHK